MLLDEIIEFCDEQYIAFGDACGQVDGKCTHPSGHCSGSCYNCLYHIHFPKKAPENSKKLYDCRKMLYHYVCQYSYLYTTELFCAFDFKWDVLKDFQYYHILSLGCGGCADLMAFDNLRDRKNIDHPISYIGIDVNELWKPIHNRIGEYCEKTGIHFKTRYDDVFSCFKENNVTDTNIIVISYLISYLYNTEKIAMINSLAKDIVDNIVNKKKTGQHLLLIINDVNSNNRGRDYFFEFEKTIEKAQLKILRKNYRYFDTGKLCEKQKIGKPYIETKCKFDIPTEIRSRYHASPYVNSTIQLLLEVM